MDNPIREIERIPFTFGMVRKEISSGYVMNFSTSEVASAGDCVITCTWFEVISGRASMGNLLSEYPPQKISPKTKSPTTNLLRILKLIMELIIMLKLSIYMNGSCRDL